MLLFVVLVLSTGGSPQTAQAQDGESVWIPGGGERSVKTREPPSFLGMSYRFPVRLHLVRGGYIDGLVEGMDVESMSL